MLVTEGCRCKEHERAAWESNQGRSRHQRGYGSNWTRLRRAVLQRDSHLCQPCMRQGRVTSARAVDHITPKAKGGTDALGNLQAICDACHKAKTGTDHKGRGA